MIGERLLNLRKDAELTHDELAAIQNINKHSISSYERDKSEPPDEVKIAFARYFHVSVDYLVGLIDQPLSYRRDANVVMLPRSFTEGQKAQLKAFLRTLDEEWA